MLCGPLGLGQDDAAARRLRAGPALPRRRDRGGAGGRRASTCARHGPAELAAAVGFVAQEPETQIVSTTVRAEVELPLELRGVAPASRARAVEEVALALAIADLLDRATDTLSGGELQRVALAAALVTRPRLILLDEPTSQLDPCAGDELIGLMRRLNEESGVAILLGEHRLERCLAAADRVVALDGGRARASTAPRPRSSAGHSTRARRWRRPGPGCSGWPGSSRAGERREAAPGAASSGAAGSGAAGERAALEPATSVRAASARAAAPRAAAALCARRLWVELGEGEEQTEALRGSTSRSRAASGSP